MKKGFKTYILTEQRRNPSWQLRHNNVFIEDAKKGLRKIRYARGAKSIFDDEIPEVLRSTPIDFADGKYEAAEADKVLNKYLQSHPEFNVKFKLLDPNRDAEIELEKIDLVDQAKEKLRSLNKAKRTAMAAILFSDRVVQTWSDERIRLELNKYLSDTEKQVAPGVSRTQYFIEKIEEPSTEVQFLVMQALRENVLAVSTDKTSVRWGKDGGVILPIAVGENPVAKMAELLLSKEGETTLQELGKRVKG